MDGFFTLMIFSIAIALVIYFVFKGRSKKGSFGENGQKARKLREECRKSMNMSKREADEIIDRSIRRLKDNHPGKSEEWYLDKFLYDLQRDRN